MRESELHELQQGIAESEREADALEAERASQVERLAVAAEQLDQAEAVTQKRLESDPAHIAQLERAQAADAIAAEAEAKTGQAETDRVEKGRPYESEPLFMYLWKRGHGTARYSAFTPLRFLDDKVAGLCGFHDARPNYAMLLEIPVRLREHAERIRAAADHEFEALRAMEEKAALGDGIQALRDAVNEAQSRLDDIDEKIRDAEERARALMHKRADYAAGADEHFRAAMDLLQTEFRRESIASLRRQAMETRGPRDDLLVRELAEMEEERERLEDALRHHKQMHIRHLERLQDLERVRREFTENRYDDVHSTFANEDLVAGMLNEFLRGVASSGDLWGSLRRHHRRRRIEADPDFGSGGFGSSGSVWRAPSSGRGGGLGGGGSGGFRTGGEF